MNIASVINVIVTIEITDCFHSNVKVYCVHVDLAKGHHIWKIVASFETLSVNTYMATVNKRKPARRVNLMILLFALRPCVCYIFLIHYLHPFWRMEFQKYMENACIRILKPKLNLQEIGIVFNRPISNS